MCVCVCVCVVLSVVVTDRARCNILDCDLHSSVLSCDHITVCVI